VLYLRGTGTQKKEAYYENAWGGEKTRVAGGEVVPGRGGGTVTFTILASRNTHRHPVKGERGGDQIPEGGVEPLKHQRL